MEKLNLKSNELLKNVYRIILLVCAGIILLSDIAYFISVIEYIDGSDLILMLLFNVLGLLPIALFFLYFQTEEKRMLAFSCAAVSLHFLALAINVVYNMIRYGSVEAILVVNLILYLAIIGGFGILAYFLLNELDNNNRLIMLAAVGVMIFVYLHGYVVRQYVSFNGVIFMFSALAFTATLAVYAIYALSALGGALDAEGGDDESSSDGENGEAVEITEEPIVN